MAAAEQMLAAAQAADPAVSAGLLVRLEASDGSKEDKAKPKRKPAEPKPKRKPGADSPRWLTLLVCMS